MSTIVVLSSAISPGLSSTGMQIFCRIACELLPVVSAGLSQVSPLSRTLQTAVAVFGGGAYKSECSLAPPLMTSAAMEASGVVGEGTRHIQ